MTLLVRLALLALIFLPAAAGSQVLIDCAPNTPCSINSGPSNTGTGDPLWIAFAKINENFTAMPSTLFSGGTIPASQGGTGDAGTITGIPYANGSNAYTVATGNDVAELFGCAGSTSSFLRGDGTCSSTLTGGLTVSSGTTSLQALVATNVTFTGTLAVSGVSTLGTTNMGALTATTIAATSASINDELVAGSLAVVGNASTGALSANATGTALAVTGGSTSGTAALVVNGGTSSANYAAVFRNNAGGAPYFETIFGDGGVTVGGPNGGDCGLGCINAQVIEQNGVPLTAVPSPVDSISSSFTLAASDCGRVKHVQGIGVTATIPANTIPAGCTIVIIMDNSSNTMAIDQGSGMTMYWAGQGVVSGNRTLTSVGVATLFFPALGGEVFISGSGIS